MHTNNRIRQPYADIFKACAAEYVCESPARPERFIRTMKRNRGGVATLTGMGLDEEGLELKNPLIAALGDSVTAGHFEGLDTIINPQRWFGEILSRAGLTFAQIDAAKLADPNSLNELLLEIAEKIPGDLGFPPAEITDTRHSYLEKFRQSPFMKRHWQAAVPDIGEKVSGIIWNKREGEQVCRSGISWK